MGTQVLEVGSRLKDCWRSQEPIRVLKTLVLRIPDDGDEGDEGDEGDRPAGSSEWLGTPGHGTLVRRVVDESPSSLGVEGRGRPRHI